MHVVTFYRFVAIKDPHALAHQLNEWTRELALKGTILLAREGVNATLTGPSDALSVFSDRLRADVRFADLRIRWSLGDAANPIFFRMKVRVRDEIVALKRDGIDPSRRTGEHVDAAAWDRLLDEPDVLLIDTRNRYEIELGTFPGAVDPGTRSFREFPEFVATLDPAQHRRIAMFCPGGIRCEKASAYLLEQGFETVYQLDGGILNYLAEAGDDNRFTGECFVFDQRVTVDEALRQGAYTSCHACRHPLTTSDIESPDFAQDEHCPYCVGQHTAQQRRAFAERARQARLAAQRGQRHVGAPMINTRSH